MSERVPEPAKKIIPFAPTARPRDEGDPMDRSGHAIIALLQQAADTANVNCDRALELARTLSMQLHVAEDRIKELEADMRHYHERAQRAETWLGRIHKDIEQRFFEPKNGRTEQR